MILVPLLVYFNWSLVDSPCPVLVIILEVKSKPLVAIASLKPAPFFKHTEVWPDRKKKAAGGILSHYVR